MIKTIYYSSQLRIFSHMVLMKTAVAAPIKATNPIEERAVKPKLNVTNPESRRQILQLA